MLRRSFGSVLIVLSSLFLIGADAACSSVIQEGGKAYIVDRVGERWDVTQAESIGFKPEGFEYGLGRNAFQPLDDSQLSEKVEGVHKNLRIIGVEEGSLAQAYSVPRLTRHEISNSQIGSKSIAVAY
jgi:hypothetical protein